MDSEGEDAEDRIRVNEGTAADNMESAKDPLDQKADPGKEATKTVQVRDGEHKAQNRIVDTLSSSIEPLETESSVSSAVSVIPLSRELGNSDSMEESKMSYSDVSDEKEENGLLPLVHTPEKVILCFDLSGDQFYMTTKFNEVNSISSLSVIKQAIEMFIHSKHMIDKRHEFAFVVVHQKAVWLQDFTNKPKDLITVLSELTETPSSSSFCLSSLFDVIRENIKLPSVEDPNLPPPYVVRAILVYSRSQCVPKFYDGKENFQSLMSSKYFNFDYVVIHESLSAEGDTSGEIANAFLEMNSKPYSLKFNICRSATKLFDTMAKLLSHPLQRYASYDLRTTSGDKSAALDSNGPA
ncbi:hypothetical protein J437_LFUL013202 [Ladona fulva]|uniref:BRISC and BRCA1-A complex member 1 n=1 Tax=Ladona fulva TaxID=123851 RepID=A0A8K0P7X1_LADFU|nr:hypothetical protein J437_LFUL013202 [Ladona fulva]